MTAQTQQPALKHYQTMWESVRDGIDDAAERDRREQAARRFLSAGFPTPADEDWKYTRLAPLTREALTCESRPSEAIDTLIASAAIPGLDLPTVVVANGRLDAARSQLDQLPEGVSIAAVDRNQDVELPVIDSQYAQQAAEQPLPSLTLALADKTLRIDIAAGTVVPGPIRLLVVNATAGMLQPLNIDIRCGEDSQATLIEDHVGTDSGAYWSNLLTRCQLEAGAQLTRIVVQREGDKGWHTATDESQLADNARLTLHFADFGGRMARRDTRVTLAAPGSHVDLSGIYCPAGRQHVDNHTRIDHAAANAVSREHFRGFAVDRGRAVFNGKIVVHPGADGTDSDQASHALLLSRGAEIDSKPELEIYADDVKCAHGATIGQLDEKSVFYLRSRGIGESAARTLLTFAFLDTLIQRIEIPALRALLEKQLLDRLPGGDTVRRLSSLDEFPTATDSSQ